MGGFILKALATTLLVSTSFVAALPTDTTRLNARDATFHGDPVKDAAIAPLPHGWYGHDATTPAEHAARLRSRDTAKEVAANIAATYGPLFSRRETIAIRTENTKRINNEAYKYDEDENVVVPHAERDHADAFDSNFRGRGKAKKAKRFSDAGAAPEGSWFPAWSKRTIPSSGIIDPSKLNVDTPERRAQRGKKRRLTAVERGVADAIKKRFVVRSADPFTCKRNNYKCRSGTERRAMADAMAGRR